jgi:hypothetical protein
MRQKNTFLRWPSSLLPVLALFGARPLGMTSVSPVVPTRLVAEAVIREDGKGNSTIFLPVTINGKAATVVLGWGSTWGGDVLLQPNMLANYGIVLSKPYQGMLRGNQGQLDSMRIGTTVMQNVPAVTYTSMENPSPQPTGLPPVIGIVGNAFLAHFDVVVDGPAHRVRLYTPGTELPPGTHWNACSPTQPVPEDKNLGFTMQIDGHSVVGVMQDNPFPVMNMAAAKLLGLTQHSPNVKKASEQSNAFGPGSDLYVVTGLHLTLGSDAFTAGPVHILAHVPLEPPGGPPTIELTRDNVMHQVFVLSSNTGRVCLGKHA